MGSNTDIIHFFLGNLLNLGSDDSYSVAFEEKRLNKRTGSWTHFARLSNDVGMSRTITKTGTQWDTIYQHPHFTSKERLDEAIIDYYKNGLTQDRIANLVDRSQSYVSNVIRRYRAQKK